MKKNLKYCFIVFLFIFVCSLSSCEQASVKVKFYDYNKSSEEETLLFPGSYDLKELSKDGLNEFVPSKEGFDFVKWTTDLEGNNEFDPKNNSSKDPILKVYALWEEKQKIALYDGNNHLKTYYYSDLVDNKETILTPTKKGYEFVNWALNIDGTTPFDEDNFDYPNDKKTINIYAQWDKIVSIIFINENIEVSRILLSDLKEGNSSLPTVNKEGYIFDKWTTDVEGQKPFIPSSYSSDNDTVKVYAQYTQKPKVSYYDESTLLYMFYLSDISSDYIPQTPTKEGYNFLGWFTSTSEEFELNTTSGKNQTAFAKWEKRATVKYYDNNKLIDTKYLDDLINESSTEPYVTKEGYNFLGWNKSIDGSGELFNPKTFSGDEKEILVYATWELIVKITFISEGKSISTALLSSLKDKTATSPSVSRDGYHFASWSLDEEGNNPFIIDTYIPTIKEINVYAQWTAMLTVTYYSDNEIYESKYLEDITSDYVPTEPIKNGYIFMGWQNSDKESFELNINSTTNQSAYALWYKNPTINNLSYNEENDKISWDAIANANYEIKIDSNEAEPISTNYYSTTDLEIGKHVIEVRVLFLDYVSQWYQIEVIQSFDFSLTNVSFDKQTRIISWDENINADYYLLRWNNPDQEDIRINTNNYTIQNSIPAGDYTIYVQAVKEVDSVIIKSNFDHCLVEIISIERLDESGLFINQNDLYVFNTGVTYTFNNLKSIDLNNDFYSVNGNSITINSTLEAKTEFTISGINNEDTQVSTNAIAECTILDILPGDSWTTYQNNTKESNKNSISNQTGFINLENPYEIGTKDNNYQIDISVSGPNINTSITDYVFDVIGTVGSDNNISDYLKIKEGDSYYYIEWTEKGKQLENETLITLTLKAHYTTKSQRETVIPSYSFKFKVNNGVNIYLDNDLREAFKNLNVSLVNIHSNILVDKNSVTNYGVMTGNSQDPNGNNAINKSVYYRQSNASDNIIINGNYFTIDASDLPKVVTEPNVLLNNAYSMYYVFVGVFACNASGSETVSVSDKTYTVTYDQKVTYSNLKIKGNATLTTTENSFLTDSGAIEGIMSTNYTTVLDNVVIFNCNEGVKLVSQNPDDTFIRNNYHLIKETSIGNCWNNCMYLYTDGEVHLKDSHFYKTYSMSMNLIPSSGAARSEAVLLKDDSQNIYLRSYPCITYDNMQIDNWSYGDEFYYTATGMSSQLAQYKTQLNTNVETLTNSKYTLLKTNNDDTTQINMTIMVDGKDNAQYEIKNINASGIETSSIRKVVEVGNVDVPDDPRATSPNYTILWPVGEYSNSTKFNELKNTIVSEITNYSSNTTWIATNYEVLTSTYGTDAVTTGALLSTIQTVGAENFILSTLYLYAFDNAYEEGSAIDKFYVEVTLPNINNSKNGLSTIIVEGRLKQ